MKKLSPALAMLMVWASLVSTLPIFCGYFIAFLLLLWLTKRRFWGASEDLASPDEFLAVYGHVMKPFFRGAMILLVTFVGANLISHAVGPSTFTSLQVLKKMSHFGIKYALLPFVLMVSWRIFFAQGGRTCKVALFTCAWFVVHTVYLLAQRQWGIDWVHGFDVVLGPHRFAYDVYRISGFMGHPLTLAYVLCLWLFTSFAMARLAASSHGKKETRLWSVVSGLSLFALLIGGSRFPLFVVLAVGVMLYGRVAWRYAKILAPLLLLAGLFLYVEGSLVGRFLELFQGGNAIADKFPRLHFWHAHWLMFWDQPFFGVGILRLPEVLPSYYQQIGYHDKIYSAHNIYLQFLADAGLFGFGGLIAFLGGFAMSARRLQRLTGSMGLWSLWFVTVLSGLLQNVLRDSEFLYALWMMAPLLVAQTIVSQSKMRQDEDDGKRQER